MVFKPIFNEYRGVAQVVERYFREVEAASSSLVTPIEKYLIITGIRGYQVLVYIATAIATKTVFYLDVIVLTFSILF